MADPPAPSKKAARVFDLNAMVAQARSGAQERSHVDWSNEIEKAKEENELRIAEMKIKADQAAKQMQKSTINSTASNDDDDDDDFGPSISLATTSNADNEDETSDDDDDDDDNNQNPPETTDGDADRLDDDEQPFFPVTHEVELKHGTKTVSCLTIDSKGERLISGGFDYELKMWDFHDMDKSI